MRIVLHRPCLILVCALALVSCDTAPPAHTVPLGDHSIVLGGKWPSAPTFRVKDGEKPPSCDAGLDGSTAMTAAGVLCVCETTTTGEAWSLVGVGGACPFEGAE